MRLYLGNRQPLFRSELQDIDDEIFQLLTALAVDLIGSDAYSLFHCFEAVSLEWCTPMHELKEQNAKSPSVDPEVIAVL